MTHTLGADELYDHCPDAFGLCNELNGGNINSPSSYKYVQTYDDCLGNDDDAIHVMLAWSEEGIQATIVTS